MKEKLLMIGEYLVDLSDWVELDDSGLLSSDLIWNDLI
jgi:hypothetical protein